MEKTKKSVFFLTSWINVVVYIVYVVIALFGTSNTPIAPGSFGMSGGMLGIMILTSIFVPLSIITSLLLLAVEKLSQKNKYVYDRLILSFHIFISGIIFYFAFLFILD